MTGFSATIPLAQIDSANATLEAQGFGPGNFSIPMRTGASAATHAGLHAWDDATFRAAVAAIPGVQITDGTGPLDVTFSAHATARALEWENPETWFLNPVMTGDRRQSVDPEYPGEWESLVDYNVWDIPINWRQIVTEGYPAWVQPTGAGDAYGLGDRVSHNGKNWQSNNAANVWMPGDPALSHLNLWSEIL